MGQAFPDTISRTAAVVAPGLMVLAIILFMGKVSGAHLNPAVSIAFSLRGDFPWRRVPGYIVAQLVGASLAALFLTAVIGVSAKYGSNYPAAGYSDVTAFVMEAVLTLGLVSVILGTASGAQNIGLFGAFGVGAYIALAGLWGSPISGASMNPARTFGPDLIGADFTSYWVYVAGPLVGACSRSERRGCCAAPAAADPARRRRRATCTPRSSGQIRPSRRPGNRSRSANGRSSGPPSCRAMLEPIRRLLTDISIARRWSREGRSFEWSARGLRLTWLSETRVLIVYFNDASRGSIGFRRRWRRR
jgi:aquaporin Z